MVAVLRWYYNERDGRCFQPELSGLFGPFPDAAAANAWIDKQDTWGGWGKYEFQVEPFYPPGE